MTGISYSEISLLERGLVASPRIGSLLALRDVYGVTTLEHLFGALPSDGWRVLPPKEESTGEGPPPLA